MAQQYSVVVVVLVAWSSESGRFFLGSLLRNPPPCFHTGVWGDWQRNDWMKGRFADAARKLGLSHEANWSWEKSCGDDHLKKFHSHLLLNETYAINYQTPDFLLPIKLETYLRYQNNVVFYSFTKQRVFSSLNHNIVAKIIKSHRKYSLVVCLTQADRFTDILRSLCSIRIDLSPAASFESSPTSSRSRISRQITAFLNHLRHWRDVWRTETELFRKVT